MERAESLTPETWLDFFLLGRRAEMNNWPLARYYYERAIACRQDDYWTWIRLMHVHGYLDRHEQARFAVDVAIGIRPDDSIGWLSRARMHGPHPFEEKDAASWKFAIKDMNSALQVSQTPQEKASCYLWRGMFRRWSGDPLGAKSDLDEAIRREPDSAFAWREIALTHEALGENEQAIASAERVLRLLQRNRPDVLAISALEVLGRYREALQEIEQLDRRAAETGSQRTYNG